MTCVIVNDGTVDSGLLHIPAAPNLDEMLTVCGWSDLNGSNEVEGEPTCEDCKKAVSHYQCLEVEP